MFGTHTYGITGSTGDNIYTVRIGTVPSCTCPDFELNRYRCKHIYYVLVRLLHVPDELVHDVVFPHSFINKWEDRFRETQDRQLAQRLHNNEDNENDEEEEEEDYRIARRLEQAWRDEEAQQRERDRAIAQRLQAEYDAEEEEEARAREEQRRRRQQRITVSSSSSDDGSVYSINSSSSDDDDSDDDEPSRKPVARKPITGECPICLEDLTLSEKQKMAVTYCASTCGNNIHLQCMANYAKHNENGWQCPLCRARWWR